MSESPRNGIVPFNGQDAVHVKRSAAARRAETERAVADLRRQRDAALADMKREREALEARLLAQQADLEARMAPLVAELKKAQEVLWTVNLYLGRDETLQLLRDGTPAPADTPITIRQRVLVMAEESLLLMDRNPSGMDARDIKKFVEWLLEDDEHLDRVLPEPKGLVVLVPTRVKSRSGNIFEDAAKDAANEESYWLLRNGDQVYLLTVDPELRVRDRVLPKRTEFVEVFDQRLFGFGGSRSEPVEPGSEEWLAMEAKADARRRHYMRIILVLQGVVDRTTVWQPLPEGGVNLLSVQAQESGRVRLIQDAEDSIQLTDGREDFGTWQHRHNNLLRPGLRIIGDWSAEDFRDESDEGRGRGGRGGHPRLHPRNASYPERNVPHLIEDRRDGGFVIRYHRTDKVYRRDVPVPYRPGYVYRGEMPTEAQQRASCLVLPSDTWVLPYDLVSVADLTYYLNSRDNRSKRFLSMVPTLRAALAAKRAEAEAEAPFRVLLAGLLIAEGADPSEADTWVEDLVHWWKIARTWSKPLNGEPGHEAKAAREIVAEYRSRNQVSATTAEAMVEAGRAVPGVICIASNRQGQWFAYAPSQPAPEGEHVFLDVTPIRRDGTLGPVRAWSKVQQRTASTLNVAWSSETWGGWAHAANPRHYLTGPERDALVTQVREQAKGLLLAVVEYHDPARPGGRGLASYAWTHGTPEDAPVRAHANPLDWHREYGDARMVTMSPYRVVKDARGARLEPGQPSADWEQPFPSAFGHYSGGSPWGRTPWWPSNTHRYSLTRERLVWADEDALDRMNAWRLRCVEAASTSRSIAEQRDKVLYAYVEAVQEMILARLTEETRTRFLEDYGPDAEDLWEAHLKSRDLRSPIHNRTLWGLFAIAHERGEPVVGRTLADLADAAHRHGNQAPGEWHPDRGVQDMHGYGDLVVSVLAEDSERQ